MMISETDTKRYYQALLDRDAAYEGTFFVGVRTTGIFCRPTCPARKPKFENCEFFLQAKEALLASYRPCVRCKPLLPPNAQSDIISKLIAAVENSPEKRWKDADFRELSIDASTARRQFKKRFGMTFVEYARARRMGLAMQQIRQGDKVIDAQLATGYESESGFRDAFSKIMGAPPSKKNQQSTILQAHWLDSVLGPMLVVADDTHLHLLEFVERRGLEREIERLRKRLNAAIIPGETTITTQIQDELELYFAGTLQTFKTPLFLHGSAFQQAVWQELMNIPYGNTRSYADQARAMGKDKAFRAVANANGANQIAIVIPCHRIINSNGELGGYGGGIQRKKWLIEHEHKHS